MTADRPAPPLSGRALGLLGAVLLLALLRVIEDPDIWFHLSFGREILTHGIPRQEFLVFTRFGEAADYNSWGFGALYFAVWSLLGPPGMALVNAAIGTATLLLLALAARQHQAERLLPLCLVLTGAYLGLEFRLVYRPETLLYLAIAAEILALERYLARGARRWLPAVPVLTALVAICHPSAVLLIGIAGLYAGQALWQRHRAGAPLGPALAPLALTLVAALAASGLTPIGYQQLILPIRFALSNAVTPDIVEFLPALATEYRYHFIALALAVAAALLYLRPVRPLDLLLCGVFGVLAFQHGRNIPLLALAGFVPCARAAQQLGDRLPSLPTPGRGLLLAGCALVLGLVPLQAGLWGIGPKPGCCTERSAALLERYHPRGNLLNFYDLGNYLGWRLRGRYPVFIDGRNNVESRGLQLHDFLFRADPGWQLLAARYDIRTIVTRATLPYSGTLIPLVEHLAQDRRWTLAAAETAGLTFLRSDELARTGLTTLPDPQALWRQVITETDQTRDENPTAPGIYRARAYAFLHLGARERALKNFRRFLALGGSDPRLPALLAATR